jgi:hypothetical protein
LKYSYNLSSYQNFYSNIYITKNIFLSNKFIFTSDDIFIVINIFISTKAMQLELLLNPRKLCYLKKVILSIYKIIQNLRSLTLFFK